MSDNFEKIFYKAKNERLSPKERADIKNLLISHVIQNQGPIVSPFSWLVFVSRHTVSVAMILLLFVSGGLGTLAEGSLPGDVLYGFKTNINEEVLGWFARSNEDRALWQISLAERRLDEIEKLQSYDKLTPTSRENIRVQLEKFTGGAEGYINSETSLTKTKTIETNETREISAVSSFRAADLSGASQSENSFNKENYLERINELEDRIKEARNELSKKQKKFPEIANMRLDLVRARDLILEVRDYSEEDLKNADGVLLEISQLLDNFYEIGKDVEEIDSDQTSAAVESVNERVNKSKNDERRIESRDRD